MKLEITITTVTPASAPGLPSHLFPGSGSDGAAFRVTSGAIPSRQEIAELLDEAIVDAYLTDYNQETGEGYFVVVDRDAPEVGAVIDLSGESVEPNIKDQDLTPAEVVVYPAISIERFYDELDRHDWYSNFSDDYSVQRRGDEDAERLLGIANQHGQDYLALFKAFSKHYFSGESWNTPKWDKPARPVDGVLLLPPAPVEPEAEQVARHQSQATVGVEDDPVRALDAVWQADAAISGEEARSHEGEAQNADSVEELQARVLALLAERRSLYAELSDQHRPSLKMNLWGYFAALSVLLACLRFGDVFSGGVAMLALVLASIAGLGWFGRGCFVATASPRRTIHWHDEELRTDKA